MPRALLLLTLIVACGTTIATAAELIPLPGQPIALSDDGKTVMLGITKDGVAGGIWTRTDGGIFFDQLPGDPREQVPGATLLYATGMSADGNTFVGHFEGNLAASNWFWERDSQRLTRVDIPPGISFTSVSPDGKTVAAHGGPVPPAYRWRAETGLQSLGAPVNAPELKYITIMAMSGDGNVIAGHTNAVTAVSDAAFVWTEANGMQALEDPPGLFGSPFRMAVSRDGSTVAFTSFWMEGSHPTPTAAVRWTPEEGVSMIPDMSEVCALSADGSILAGTWIDPDHGEVFAVRDPVHGTRTIYELAAEYDFEVPNLSTSTWQMQMSPDGRFIAAIEDYTGLAFLLDLAPTGDTNGDLQVDLVDLNNVRNHFGAAGDPALGDTNGDGTVDLVDLNNVRNHFGQSTYGGTAPVPEPGGLALAAIGAIIATCFARRQQVVR